MFAKRDLAPVILLCVLAGALLAPALLTASTYFFRDITYLFHPWKTLAAEMLQKGEVPLWNPYAYCGMPLLANWQSAVFYPFSLLFSLFPFPEALKAYYGLHLFLCGFFAYLFGKKNGFSRGASAGMAVLFSLCGFTLTKLEFLSYAGALPWTFALLLLIDHPVCLAAALAFAFCAGYPVFFLQLFVVLSFLLAVRRPPAAGLKTFGAAGLLAACLAAIQLLPTLELVFLSGRAREGIASAAAFANSLSFKDLLRLVSPWLSESSLAPVAGEKLQYFTSNHVGFAAFALILWALISRPLTARKLWAVSLVFLGILLALGDSTPVYPWLYRRIGILGMLRYPSQFIFLSIAGLVVLLGEGLRPQKRSFILVCFIAAELLFLGWDFQPLAGRGFFYTRAPHPELFQQGIEKGRFILSPGTEKDRYIAGRSISEAWQKARLHFYGLTCLPYHAYAAYGFGEPLAPASVESLADQAYTQPTPQAALPYYKAMGVSLLICRKELPDASGYTLLAREPFFVYRLPQPEVRAETRVYDPASFHAGLWLTLAALILTAIYGIIKLRAVS